MIFGRMLAQTILQHKTLPKVSINNAIMVHNQNEIPHFGTISKHSR